MNNNLLKPIVELSYLNAQNVDRYRCIMRCFYEHHRRLQYWLRPEEVYRGVMTYGLLENYTIEQCQQDLNQLVEWKNLVPQHDGGRSTTVEEYLRKKFRYMMTPYSVEIERLVVSLENIRGYGGSLEPSLFESIALSLQRMKESSPAITPQEALALWEELYETFTKLTENAADYIASLQSSKTEELMQTEAFLAYKNSVAGYLQGFVHGLQRHAYRIEGILPLFNPEFINLFFEKVQNALLARPQLDEPVTPEEYMHRLQTQWHSLNRWFLGESGEKSDVYYLEQTTKDTIARIVRAALRIQEKRRSGISRRRELDYLGQWFFSLASAEEAHRLAAYAFGLYRCRHFQGEDDKDTESPDVSMWQAGPNIRGLRSRSRKKGRSSGPDPVKNQQTRQQKAKAEYLAHQRQQAELLGKFLEQGSITISSLDTVPASTRQVLLKWIGLCLANKSRQIRTPDGIEISLLLPENRQRTVLHCEDGELDMPDYTLNFRQLANSNEL
ncbi:hypothetical protein P378_01175 [Desulforamulus profundi]|uniref:TIGR02677 family protein n=1 Tax=Desulforamulus profundi TaxID=1383067 RepID=A0A2C6MJR4_9FIRM|nr:TIGR02677 family protein [Desulforamulus profundi]PHJ39813.1 hypothetical protein P378_01175 [Desulforamulus profundi]